MELDRRPHFKGSQIDAVKPHLRQKGTLCYMCVLCKSCHQDDQFAPYHVRSWTRAHCVAPAIFAHESATQHTITDLALEYNTLPLALFLTCWFMHAALLACELVLVNPHVADLLRA